MSQRVRTVLKLILTIVLLVVVLSQVELEKFSHTLASIDSIWVLIALSLQLLAVLPSVQRWRLILRNFQIQTVFFPLTKLALIGNFFNLFLPTSIGGDFIRGFYLSRDSGRGISSILTTILLERSSGLCGLLLIGTLSSALSDLHISGFKTVNLFLLLLTSYVLLNFLLFLPWVHGQMDRWLRRWQFDSVAAKMELIYQGLQTLLKDWKGMVGSLSLSLLIQFNSIFVMWLLAQAIGITVSFSTFLIFIPLINLTIMVPLTISGFGLREGAYFLLFSQVGLPAELSIMLSLLNYLMLFLSSFPGAVFYSLRKKEEHFSELATRAEMP